MTDDELESALFALPLEESPADLRSCIFALTIDRPLLTFQAWEIWAVGTLSAFMVWLAFLVASSVPDIGGTIARTIGLGVDRFAGSVPLAVLLWTGLGASFVVWVSALSLPPSRREIANR